METGFYINVQNKEQGETTVVTCIDSCVGERTIPVVVLNHFLNGWQTKLEFFFFLFILLIIKKVLATCEVMLGSLLTPPFSIYTPVF